MTLYKYYLFLEILKDMNLHITADRLYITQQCLSSHIKQMEAHYHIKLFERNPGLALTNEGMELAREARVITDAENRLQESFGQSLNPRFGSIRVGCSLARSCSYMPAVLSEFNKLYPAVNISFSNENYYRELSAFPEDSVDIVVGHAPKGWKGIRIEPLFEVSGCFVVSDALLRKHMGDGADAFIERANSGVELDDFPSSVPLAITGVPGGKSFVMESFPEIASMRHIFINPADSDRLISACTDGRGMLMLSKAFVKYLRGLYPDFGKGLHFFPHYKGGAPWLFTETCFYPASKKHPGYFYDFINILAQKAKATAD